MTFTEKWLNNFIDGIEARAAPPRADDYLGKDGLIYCSKCNTPKQCRIELFKKEKIVPCLCKCEIEKRDAEEALRKQQEQEKRIKQYRKMGFPESDMLDWTFEHDDGLNPKLTNAMKAYVENFDKFRSCGKGLLLYGSVGTGKTYAAASVANALIDKGYPCLVTNFARLANTLQGLYDGRQDYIDSLNRFDLLVIDDLAAERSTEYMQEQVFNIINSRYVAGLPMIITTNLTGDELKHPDSISKERIYSRILERCHPIEVAGSDRRKGKLKNDFAEMHDILGL